VYEADYFLSVAINHNHVSALLNVFPSQIFHHSKFFEIDVYLVTLKHHTQLVLETVPYMYKQQQQPHQDRQ